MDKVTQYCYDVLDGKIIAGNSVKLACKRHLNDLENSKLAPFKYRFDVDKANEIIEFANTLIINEGEEIVKLKCYPFQEFILGSLMGWVTKDGGYRRYRSSYVQVGRQNGKSFLNGILCSYLGNFSGYRNGKIFCVATKHDQAKIVWDEVNKFIQADEDLNELFTVKEYASTIICNNTGTVIKALGRDTKSLDGFRPLLAVIDEYHSHKNAQMYNLMEDGQLKMKQTLISVITTAGFNIDGVCHQMYRYCKKVLNGEEKNDEKFIFIAEMDEGDDTADKHNWIKANPILEYDKLALDKVQTVYAQAKSIGGVSWNDFQTKRLNMWVEFTEKRYMNMTQFRECASDLTLEDFRGHECNIGMDLSSGGDLTSIIFEFTFMKDGEKKYFVHHHSFIPSKRIGEHEKTDNAPYQMWVDMKLLTATTSSHGIKTDYRAVKKYIQTVVDKYNLQVQMIYYDQANASAFVGDMEEISDTLEVWQNSKSLNDSVMDIKYEVEAGNIYYNKKDELLIWSMNNAELTDPYQGKVMLNKNSRFKRIDPIAAWVDVHKFSMRNEPKELELTEDYIASFYNK